MGEGGWKRVETGKDLRNTFDREVREISRNYLGENEFLWLNQLRLLRVFY